MSEVRIRRASKVVGVTVGTAAEASSSVQGGDRRSERFKVDNVNTETVERGGNGSADGLTFAPLYGADGVAATLTIPAEGGSGVLPDSVFAVSSLKLVSDVSLGTAATAVVVWKS